ncbi:unnamed protein product [Schistosoma turkestanicum]|nr:unnamed protein product [Schistosoma turkestanicum]
MVDCADTFSTTRNDDKETIVKSEVNDTNLNTKTSLFHGAAWYVPSERRWVNYDDYRALPRVTNRDAIDFQSEEDFMGFLKKRDVPNYKKITAYYPSHPPSIKFGTCYQVPSAQVGSESHHRTKPNSICGYEYYEYYHQILDEMKTGDYRKLSPPDVTVCSIPSVTHNQIW